jgi:hypothetical protein
MRALPLSVHMPEQVDVKPGEEWLVVTCHNHSCDRTILIDPVGPEMRDDEGDLIFPADTVLVFVPIANSNHSTSRTKFDASRGSKGIDFNKLIGTHSKGA